MTVSVVAYPDGHLSHRISGAARFASGYLAAALTPDEQPAGTTAVDGAHGTTHASAQIYLLGAGWIDVDPPSGSVGKASLVTVAVVRDPV